MPNASATVSEGADRPERSVGKKTFDNRILILRRFKKRFGSESNPSAKVLHFFDMAMGWFGLRAVLVRIACMCPNDWAKQEKKVEKNTRSNRSNIGNYAEYDKFYSSYINYSGYSL